MRRAAELRRWFCSVRCASGAASSGNIQSRAQFRQHVMLQARRRRVVQVATRALPAAMNCKRLIDA